MKLMGSIGRNLLGVLIAALVSNAGCAKDTKPEETQPAAAKSEEPAEVAEAAPAAAPPTTAATSAASAEPAAPEIDPARMPVEEDFIEEAASRIGKSANLDAELNRIAAEIKKSSQK